MRLAAATAAAATRGQRNKTSMLPGSLYSQCMCTACTLHDCAGATKRELGPEHTHTIGGGEARAEIRVSRLVNYISHILCSVHTYSQARRTNIGTH